MKYWSRSGQSIRLHSHWIMLALVTACGPQSAEPQEQPPVRISQQALHGGSTGIENPTEGPAFRHFETGQVRPLSLSRSGDRLFALNTPDNRLEIFAVGGGGLRHRASVSVGLEPIALAVRNDDEVWVVNHLSDSVSIVDVSDDDEPRVKRTLLVGDEPRDIVFAGQGRSRAFITTAHRGQNSPIDPQLTTPGVGRADVWVFSANQSNQDLGGSAEAILTFFTDTPRALAVTPDGSKVYVAGFLSGNQTTIVPPPFVLFPPREGQLPATDAHGVPAPPVGLIVKYDGTNWLDSDGGNWSDVVNFNLPDRDVFAIDANAETPVPIAEESFARVGSVLFNMIVNPQNGSLYVSNLSSENHVRFEGPGIFGGSTVRGHLAESRITVIDSGGVSPRHLNKHIDYSTCCGPIGQSEAQRSLAFPEQMAISADGSTLYVSAFGSSKVGVFDTGALENDSFIPNENSHIAVSGGGPSGLVLDENRRRLYVLTRFDNSISIVDTAEGLEVGKVAMFNPEPAAIVDGRRFLYDATYTSTHGDSACASCHIHGDNDALAWDLGNPDDEVLTNPGPFRFRGPLERNPDFHPMKGPMTTQSLRGMDNHGPMHWRGDRTGGNDGPSEQPNSGTFDENAAFLAFNPAFEGLIGRDAQLTQAEMQAFADFILPLSYPPNPIRNLDNSLTAEQAAGRDIYFNRNTLGIGSCNDCHVLDPNGNSEFGVAFPGFFGTDGLNTVEPEPQFFKIPHLRNVYTKVGMFGMAPSLFTATIPTPHTGDQIRGFGIVHDGAIDNMFTFFSTIPFAQNDEVPIFGLGVPVPEGFVNDEERRQVEAFVHAFDSNLAPIVGQQITLAHGREAVVGPRIDLLLARADAGECDVSVKGVLRDREVGFLYVGNGSFQPDRAGRSRLSDDDLRSLTRGCDVSLTYTCVPPGSGVRIAIDRDLDGVLDGDEDSGSTWGWN
ncbi:MAG: hypothetical protein OEZ06_28675 [Myxococcales bacterium]|nr:hypothetical protein [Myxococcales bacterium]